MKKRSFIVLIGAVVLILALSIPMMQCAPSGEEVTPPEEEVTPPEEEVTPPEEEEIKYGGRLNVGWGPGDYLEDLIIDSSWEYESMGCLYWQLLYDQLWIMGPAPDYEVLPMLATSWETEDGKTWVFHLRDDAVFHDGVPVTAEDVAFSMKYLPYADPSFAYPDCTCEPGSIKVIDDYAVQFTLEAPLGGSYAPFYWSPIIPQHIWEPYKNDIPSYANDECIGSGPFKLKELEPAQYLWLVANEDYWGGRPYVDEVVFKTYGSYDAYYMAMKKGEVDMYGYDGISGLVVDEMEENENIETFISPGIGVEWLTFNLHKDGPLQDLNVRKAIMHGIDRDRNIDMALSGYAEKTDSFMYLETPDHNPNLPQYDYDPDLANKILDDAGYVDTDGDGIRNDPEGRNLSFELVVPSAWTAEVKASALMKEQLKDIGIEIIIRAMDTATFYDFIYAPTTDIYDIGFNWEEPGPYADWIWEFCRSWKPGSWNTAYYNNPEFDETLDKYLSERDLTKRREYLYEMQMMIAEDLPYGFLDRPDIINSVRTDKFEGWVETMGGISTWINPWTYFKVHLK